MLGVLASACLVAPATASIGGAASSSVVVTMTVPSSVSITDRCTDTRGHRFGSVLPGMPAITATDAAVCGIEFDSSNDSVMLRASQADAAGAAMTSSPTAWQVASAGTLHLKAVSFAPATTTGWAVGSNGTLLRSTDSGDTWAPHACAPCGAFTLYDVSAATASAVFVGASGGRVFRFDGTTWEALPLIAPANAVDNLDAPDASTVWIAGDDGYMWRSTNAAGPAASVSWTQFRPTTQHLNGLDAVSASEVFAVGGGGTVVRSIDGGATFGVTTPASTYGNARDVAATSSTEAVLVTSGGVAMTTVDGAAWTPRSTPGLNELTDTVERIGATVYLGSEFGRVARSGDGGASWTILPTRTTGGVLGIAMVNAATVVAVGHGKTVQRSTDSGATWEFEHMESPTLGAVAAVDGSEAFAVGDEGSIRRTTDGGTTWVAQASPTTQTLRGVATTGTAGDRLIAVGDQGTIVTSTDSGTTWTIRPSGTTQRLRAVTMVDDYVAWAAGDAGTVLRTSNGGTTWTAQASTTALDLYGVAASTKDRAWAGGGSSGNRIIIGTVDAGATWASQVAASGRAVTALSAAASSTFAVAVRLDGTTYRTTDGSTWTAGAIPGSSRLFSVSTVGDGVAFASGTDNIFRSLDGGATWLAMSGVPYESINGIDAVDPDTVYGVGNGGRSVRPVPLTNITDYGAAPNSWGGASTAGLFGICLQSVGAGTTATWTADATGVPARCEISDSDPWRAVPVAPSKVASTTAGTPGRANFVFGVRPADGQPSGSYYATITFEAIAPSV